MNQNNAMKILLKANKISFPECNIDLDADLQNILSSGIDELSGCYFLKKLIPSTFNIEDGIKLSFDRTQLECEVNHIHVGDYLKGPSSDSLNLLKQGLCYVIKLHVILSKINDFKIILAYVSDPILDCNIRFHKKRRSENWLADDLEKYEEAILCIE